MKQLDQPPNWVGGVSGHHQGRANGVSQVNGDVELGLPVPAGWVGGRFDKGEMAPTYLLWGCGLKKGAMVSS